MNVYRMVFALIIVDKIASFPAMTINDKNAQVSDTRADAIKNHSWLHKEFKIYETENNCPTFYKNI